MLLTGHKTRAVFDRYNIVNEQELLTAGERLAAYLEKSETSRRYNRGVVMSIKVSYKDGVFRPLEGVESAKPGTIYTLFSEEELLDIRETIGWLKAAEQSFDFWNNPDDAVYDTL